MKLSEIPKPFVAVTLAASALIITALAVFGRMPISLTAPFAKPSFSFQEGPVLAPTITVGPFDIHRRYRSMEGPFADLEIRMGDLAAAQNAVVPEALVKFIENGDKASMKSAGEATKVGSLPDTSAQPPSLYWIKGFKLEVLDENGRTQPTAEFICHFNLDVDVDKRNQIFNEAERCTSSRILTITQGQTEVTFPDGFGVPVASDEKWRFVFQAANRTTDQHRRVKHRLTIYMLPDKSLVEPITALNWFVPYVNVVVDKNTVAIAEKEKSDCPLCYGTARGVNAPNATSDSVGNDVYGRKITGHWVVPPGKNTWTSLVREDGFSDKDRLIHAVWSHIHPCCASISLIKIANRQRESILVAKSSTIIKPGVQIHDIDYISSKEGIPLPRGNQYEIDISYDNQTGQPLDSMAVMGIFCEDNEFARPKWAYEKDSGQFCGIGQEKSASKCSTVSADSSGSSAGTDVTPIFNAVKDGPLLSQSKKIKIQTSDGNLTFNLEPRWAPKTATQMAKLFENHVFDGTEIARYEKDFIFQISLAESKAPGFAPLTVSEKKLIRRIPLEVDQQFAKQIKHTPGMLSMAREDNDTSGNTTSFSILIGNAPHLDTKYTIFGKLTDTPENRQTLNKMTANWPKHPYIIKTLSN
jgi:cyclophilin family peptidyl-prolyl cis-trans isomerase